MRFYAVKYQTTVGDDVSLWFSDVHEAKAVARSLAESERCETRVIVTWIENDRTAMLTILNSGRVPIRRSGISYIARAPK